MIEPIGRAIGFPLEPGARYLGVACKTCAAPVPLVQLPLGPIPPSPVLGTRFRLACADEACLGEHSYGPEEIWPFRWPGRK